MLLEIRKLKRRFGGILALDDLSLRVPTGCCMGVIGPNGAGKSTMVNVITGHLAPSSGAFLLDGHDMTAKPPWKLARAGVARTFQVMRPLSGMSVRDNVAIGAMYARGIRATEAREIASDLLSNIGLGLKANSDTTSLGIADNRRLELARALAGNPRLLVLDEILAGLEASEVAAFLDLLMTLKHTDLTIIIVDHHMGAIRTLCDQVVALERGALVISGPTMEVLSDQRVVDSYLGGRHPGIRR